MSTVQKRKYAWRYLQHYHVTFAQKGSSGYVYNDRRYLTLRATMTGVMMSNSHKLSSRLLMQPGAWTMEMRRT